jgi:hypothetical protein
MSDMSPLFAFRDLPRRARPAANAGGGRRRVFFNADSRGSGLRPRPPAPQARAAIGSWFTGALA